MYLGPVQGRPLQDDDARRVVDPPVARGPQRIFQRPDVDADVLVLLRQTMYATDAFVVVTADEQVHHLIDTVRRRQVPGYRPERAEGQPGLPRRLVMGHLLRLFVLVDQTGGQPQQSGVGELLHRPDAELLDEHHAAALRTVGQHADRVMADEQFPTDFPAHVVIELAVL